MWATPLLAYYRNLRDTVKEIGNAGKSNRMQGGVQKTDLPTLITLIGNREIALENTRNKKMCESERLAQYTV